MASDNLFAGSIPEIYDRFLVPQIFEPYACDLAVRLWKFEPDDVLEIAAGTGVLTRAIASRLPRVRIVATGNRPLPGHAAAKRNRSAQRRRSGTRDRRGRRSVGAPVRKRPVEGRISAYVIAAAR
jgi:hypothetical protein